MKAQLQLHKDFESQKPPKVGKGTHHHQPRYKNLQHLPSFQLTTVLVSSMQREFVILEGITQ